MTFEQYRTRHAWQPTPAEQAAFQVTPDPKALADARAAKQAAAQALQVARMTPGGDESKPIQAYNTATDAVNKLQQQAQIETVKNQQAWQQTQNSTLADNFAQGAGIGGDHGGGRQAAAGAGGRRR